MRTLSLAAAAALTALAAAIPASAQEIPEFVEQERRAEMGPAGKMADEFFWDWGGWLRTDGFWVDDKPFNHQRSFRFFDLRLWALMEVNAQWRFYGRMYNHWIQYNEGDGFGDDDVWRRVRPDVFYAEGRFEDVLIPGVDLTARLGRQFHSVGRGTLFFDNADGIRFEIDTEEVDANIFAARSIRHSQDIDQTRPEPSSTNRMYYGAEVLWDGIENHRLYLMGFSNDDKNHKRLAFQEFSYDSQYIGAGVRGNPVSRISYQTEFIYEFGSSPAEFSTGSEKISAYSITSRVNWVPDTDWDLRLHAEYLFGSGDSDRGSPVNTIGGNDAGSTDLSFLAFGFVPTGYALFPRLANLHVVTAGAAFKPFLDNENELFRDMEFGGSVFYFFKHHHQAGISDSRASLPDRDIGPEVDMFMRWRIFSDLGFTFRLGLFFPGDAFPSAGGANDLRKFVSAGFVLSF